MQNNSSLKKISTRPFFLGAEKFVIENNVYYFDDVYFYVMDQGNDNSIRKYLLETISEIRKTTIKINNRRIWQVKLIGGNKEELIFTFAHNFSIWNNNFPSFLEKIAQMNPNIVKTKWNFWNI